MITSTLANSPTAVAVEVSEEELTVFLSDGRVVRVPLSWYPRLSNALPQDRATWEFIGGGHGIHWPGLDEDISVENVLLGQPSGESARSFARWKIWYRQKVAQQSVPPNGDPTTPSVS
jgi:hypothetical protein